jgi:predicted ATP-grasp superfamily ATP-dependent carboligase
VNVVILGFGTPSLIFARSCRAKGISAILLEPRSGVSNYRRYSSCLSGGATIDPELIGTPEGLSEIRSYLRSVNARALLAIDDKHIAWLAEHRDLFEPECVLLTTSAASLARLMDKRIQIEAARAAGLDVLPTWHLHSLADISVIPPGSYPVCVRPSCPDSVQPSFKAEVLQDAAALEQFLRQRTSIRAHLIAQPFVLGPNLVVHGVRSPRGDSFVLKAFLAYRKHEGFTLALKPAVLPKEIEASCRSFTQSVGLTGSFHFELLQSCMDGRAYFLEVNARLGGTTDKVMRLGFDEPALLLEAFGVLKVVTMGRRKPGAGNVIGKRLMIHNLLAALSGKTPAIDYPRTSRPRQVLYSLWALVFARDAVLDWSDLHGSLWYLLFKNPHFRQRKLAAHDAAVVQDMR